MSDTPNDSSCTPARRVPFEGVSNFRDLGGYRGHEGRAVRWRELFRSDRLSDLSAQDVQQLQALGVRHCVDFRGDAERVANDYAIEQVQRTALPIEPQVVKGLHELKEQGRELDVATAERLMAQTYEGFVLHNGAQFRAFFDVLLSQSGPVVFHCTAGKDRTGFAAAIVLEALGVDRASIAQDFLLTNDYYALPHALSGVYPPEAMNVFWRVQPAFLDAAWQQMERSFGGSQGYFLQGLGLQAADLERLRERYLE